MFRQICEGFEEERKTMEQKYSEIAKLLQQVCRCRYFHSSVPLRTVCDVAFTSCHFLRSGLTCRFFPAVGTRHRLPVQQEHGVGAASAGSVCVGARRTLITLL